MNSQNPFLRLLNNAGLSLLLILAMSPVVHAMVLDEFDSALYSGFDYDPLRVESVNPASQSALMQTGLRAEITNADSGNGVAWSATIDRVHRDTTVASDTLTPLGYSDSHHSTYLIGNLGTILCFVTNTIYATNVVAKLRGFHL